MSFRSYAEKNYAAACGMLHGFSHDAAMVDMLGSGKHDPNLVKDWMRSYGLFQGIKENDRNKAVAAFLDFSRSHRRIENPTDADIERIFGQLHEALYRAVKRRWISAASKLLWCLYPARVVIYDTFVHRALSVMQCLDDDLTGFKRIGAAPSVKNISDANSLVTQHYMNYQGMVRKLQSVHQPLLDALRSKHKDTYPHDVRIMDKLLWMIGDVGTAH